jgi:hypothetical protein
MTTLFWRRREYFIKKRKSHIVQESKEKTKEIETNYIEPDPRDLRLNNYPVALKTDTQLLASSRTRKAPVRCYGQQNIYITIDIVFTRTTIM